jgi:hypothetical protein
MFKEKIKNIIKEISYAQPTKMLTVPERAYERALEVSCDYAEKNMTGSLMFFKPTEIWDYTIELLKSENEESINCYEFGVFKGRTINYFSKSLPEFQFYGFDSFRGLQTDWKGWSLTKGAFNLDGIKPNVNPNVELIDGWFDKTLPVFIKDNKVDQIQFIHIDSDTYESAELILDLLGDKMTAGTVILFDEYFGYRGWEIGEYKAFQEFVSKKNIKYEYLAFCKEQVLVRIIS